MARFDEKNLCPEVPGKRFNSSLMRFGAGYVFCFRNGWAGSDIYVAMLDKHFLPTGQVKKLELWHEDASYGREDPRLFWFRGQLHVAYIGVVGRWGRVTHTNVLYARLSPTFDVEAIFHPQYDQRNLWEKNWQFFDHDGQLYAIYSIAPHRILRIDGDQAEMVFNTPTPARWDGGEMRGGASPVLVDDEWWSFFHDRVSIRGHRVYRAGVYTFDSKPPFRVRRIIPKPIMTANQATKPADQYASVVFPCGAVRNDDKWIVSCGIHDRWSELHAFGHDDLDGQMVELTRAVELEMSA